MSVSLRLRTDRQSERIPRINFSGIVHLFIRGSSRRLGRYFTQGDDSPNRTVTFKYITRGTALRNDKFLRPKSSGSVS
jgi:hypothetical protein